MTKKNGNTYEGNFIEEEFDGYGIYTFKNGRKYTGNWKKGRMNGYGTMLLEDQSIYSGNFQNDIRHGQATLTLPDGREFKGEFQNARRHNGVEQITSKDGSVSILSKWKNGCKLVIATPTKSQLKASAALDEFEI